MEAVPPTVQPLAKPPKLLDQVRRCIRNKHYSLRTEENYAYWIRWYTRFHGLRHPIDMVLKAVIRGGREYSIDTVCFPLNYGGNCMSPNLKVSQH